MIEHGFLSSISLLAYDLLSSDIISFLLTFFSKSL